MPPVTERSPATTLQGFELVVHVFVAADGTPADRRFVEDLWHRCVAEFALDEAVASYPADWPAALPATGEGETLLAVRSGPDVHQVAARRVHDVLCLSLILAPPDAPGWTELEASWARVRRPPTPGVLGTARILQARLAETDAALDVAALAPVVAERSGTAWWRPGVLRARPYGPFAVWEAGDGETGEPAWEGRADRCIAVLAPADHDAQLSAWTWSRGPTRLTPFARYLLHAAKVRFELRVRATSSSRALRNEADSLVRQLERAVGAGRADDVDVARAARLRALEIRLHRVRAWLTDLRTAVRIAARNMREHAGGDQSGGLFADDRALAAWLDGQLGHDLAHLKEPLKQIRRAVENVTPLLPQPPSPGAERPDPAAEEDPVTLTPAQRKQLIDALVAAFPSYDELDLMLDTERGRRLPVYAAPGPLPVVVHKLVRSAESQGWTAELVTGAALSNPGNPRLRELIDSGQLDVGRAVRAALGDASGAVQELLPQAGILGEGVPAELEHVVRIADGFQNVVVFATKLLEVAGRVCWVEILTGSGRSSGTGFLVGPDLVLTNHHVLAEVIDGRTTPAAVHCVFDYHIRADGTPDRGVAFGLAHEWLVAARPPSAVDAQPDPVGAPAPDELDYALVRLAGRPGDTDLPGGRSRGWLDLREPPPPEVRKGTPLLIVQHPDGHPQKLAIDSDGVLAVNANRTRFRYGVNTLDGSSGSPCLTFGLNLLGLHHSGTKDRRVKRNESIPIEAIVADLRARGADSVLPG